MRALLSRRLLPLLFILGLAVAMPAAFMKRALPPVSAASSLGKPPAPSAYDDKACAGCHRQIYDSYERTSMARGSGPLSKETLAHDLPRSSFLHQASGVRYKVFSRNGTGWMSFARNADALPDAPGASPVATTPQGVLEGERELRYFIGSGKHGRTFLYEVEGTWFELPINFYTRRNAWDMAPAFDRATTMPADLPADPGCLHCHATGVAAAMPGSRSHYAGAPFVQGGIGCSACHGDPAAHLAAGGKAPILNPDKLNTARRDSVCLSCHLEGDAVVYKPGRSLAQFEPGDELAADAVYYVRADSTGGGGRAASQYEALLRSACKRGAGDRLTCTTCHDPHASPGAEERVAYYRGRCLACHASPAMTTHHPEEPDCAHCHMPARATSDISHEQSVDHNIERIPASAPGAAARTGEMLLPVGDWKSSDRELGLAYAQMAGRGDRPAGERALALLARAEKAGASDAELHARLGTLRQLAGDRAQARAEYMEALAQDPYEASALGNLAVLDATEGHPERAVPLLTRLVERDPAQTAAGLNLAFIECKLGRSADASQTLALLARYNPDDPALRAFRERGSYAGQQCRLPPPEGDRARE